MSSFSDNGLVEASAVGERPIAQSDRDRPAPMLVLPHVRGAPSGAGAIARRLADVLARIPEDAPVSTLTSARELYLVNGQAPKYRRSLNKPAGAA